MTLGTALHQLESADLVRRQYDEELAYWIKHPLVQETARASLLHHDRKRLNRLVGELLERLYPERTDENAVRLAQHFLAAGDDAKGYAYSFRAGELALRVHALAEALEHFTLALTLAPRADVSTEAAYLKRGRVLELMGRFHDAAELYRAMYAASIEQGNRAAALEALMAQATIHAIPSLVHDAARAKQLSAQALELARALDHPAAEAKILWNLMLVGTRVNTVYREGITYGEQSLAIAREHDLREQIAYDLKDLAPVYAFLGDPQRGSAYNAEADARWQQLDNPVMRADNLNYAVMMHLLAGEYAEAIAKSEAVVALTRAIGNEWGETFAQTWIGGAFLESGEITRALDVMREAIRLGARSLNAPLMVTRADLASLYAGLGEAERALPLAQAALETADSNYPAMRNWALGALVHAQLACGQLEAARAVLSDPRTRIELNENARFSMNALLAQVEFALAQAEYAAALELSAPLTEYLARARMRAYQPTALLLHARALTRLAQTDRAAEALYAARELAEGMHARWSLWQVLAALGEVETARGDTAAAEGARAQARGIIDYIAARTPADLRASLLATRRVRALLSTEIGDAR